MDQKMFDQIKNDPLWIEYAACILTIRKNVRASDTKGRSYFYLAAHNGLIDRIHETYNTHPFRDDVWSHIRYRMNSDELAYYVS